MSTVDLYTARGEFIRRCTGIAQARETVYQIQPGAISMRLSADRSQILIRFPGSKKDYTYILRPPSESQCDWCGETFLDSDLFVTDVGVLCERCKNGMVRSRL